MEENASRTEAYAERYLQGALRVAQAGKPDAIYTLLRRLVREGKFHALAARSREVAELVQSLSRYYKELAEVLEQR